MSASRRPASVVGGDGMPRSKRQRIALACDSCRARKTRCDGARPYCGVCVAMDFDCVYQRPGRGSMASSHEKEIGHLEARLQTMEMLLREMVTKSNDSNNPYNNSHITGAVSKDLHVSSNLSPSSNGSVNDTVSLLHSATAETGITEDTVDGMGAITFIDESESGYFGPTSNSAFFLSISNALPPSLMGASQHASGPISNHRTANYISQPPSPRPASSQQLHMTSRFGLRGDRYSLPPKPKITELVELFFTRTGMVFPYIYKRWISEGIDTMDPTDIPGTRPSWLCLLNTVMAFATCLAAAPKSNVQVDTTEADAFLQRALQLLPDTASKPANLETLQALLLVTQYLQGTKRSAQTWSLHRLAVQVAFQMGVHSAARLANYSPLEREIRKRAWYMCFILDKTCSMTFGRPPTIPNDYVLLDLPQDIELEDLDHANHQPQHTLSTQPTSSTVALYIHSIKIYQIIGNIIGQVYQSNIESEVIVPSAEVFQRILSIERKLSEWKSQLPPNLQLISKEDIIHASTTDGQLHLQLSAVITLRFLNARILLHRTMICRFLACDGGGSTTSNDIEEWAFLKRFGRSSLEICTLSAVEMINVIDTLSRAEHLMLTTWWFLIYYIFSSALVIFSMIIVRRKHAIQFDLDNLDLAAELQKALATLENVGHGTRIASRCQKYLTKLVQISHVLGDSTENFLNGGNHQPSDEMAESSLLQFSPLDFQVDNLLGSQDWDGIFAIYPNTTSRMSDTMLGNLPSTRNSITLDLVLNPWIDMVLVGNMLDTTAEL